MKILLTAINAKYIHINLAVRSLRASAEEYREHIEIAEYTINNQKDYILGEIYKKKPDVLCFSCYIWNIEYVNDIAREFHKLCPDVPIWAGGPEVSYETERFIMEHECFAGVMLGEGEETFRELCGYYVQHDEGGLHKICGIAYRGFDGQIVYTAIRQPLDMNKLKLCYDENEDMSNRIVYYESSRGCPFSCSYCLSSVDKNLRFKDIELVKKELQFFIDRKTLQIKLVDRTFNCNRKHAMAVWKYIKEHDNGVTNFHFEISADLLDEEELTLMSELRPGLIQLEIGVQSTNEATVKEIRRTMRLERLKANVRRIKSAGNIHVHLDLIAGLPYEDFVTFCRSFDEIYALKPNQLQLGFLKVLKGSYMYERAKEYGIIYQDKPPYEVLATKWLSYDDVLVLKQAEEMLEVYYNSGQYEVTMNIFGMLFESAFDMYKELGSFYEKKGYFGLSHSRMRRCEILLEFAEMKFGDGEIIGGQAVGMVQCGEVCNESAFGIKSCREGRCNRQSARVGQDSEGNVDIIGLIKEALTFDLYSRENCKSRPVWAPDVASFRAMTHTYCKNGKMSHIEPFHYHFTGSGRHMMDKLPQYVDETVWVLFCYDRRNPMDNRAWIEEISTTALPQDAVCPPRQ